jgi:hypothetical protein
MAARAPALRKKSRRETVPEGTSDEIDSETESVVLMKRSRRLENST